MRNNLEVVLGIAFAIAILLVSIAHQPERHAPPPPGITEENADLRNTTALELNL